WELEQLTGGRGPLDALLVRWLATHPRTTRLREWLKLALHPNRAPLPVSPLRAVAPPRRATPPALLYAARTPAHRDPGAARRGPRRRGAPGGRGVVVAALAPRRPAPAGRRSRCRDDALALVHPQQLRGTMNTPLSIYVLVDALGWEILRDRPFLDDVLTD